MFTVEARIQIERPVADVYRYLIEPTNFPRWIADVRSIQARGPFKEGQTFEEVTVFQGQEKQSTGEVVTVRENSTLIVRVVAVHSGPKLLPTRSYIVRPVAGGTELVWRSDVRVAGMMRLFVPLLPGLFRRKKAGYLATLKQLLETQAMPASTGSISTGVAR